MSPEYDTVRQKILDYCARMVTDRLVYHVAGNISARVPGTADLIAMTPTATPYDAIRLEDIPIVTLDGTVVDGAKRPTSEMPLHTMVYLRRPEVGAIVHTHSPAATTMANLGWTLPAILTGPTAGTGGDVRTAPYARPGSPELADVTEEALKDRGACFLEFHGVLAVGADLAWAYDAAACTEAGSEVYLRLRQCGEWRPLPATEVDWLAEEWRSQFGS